MPSSALSGRSSQIASPRPKTDGDRPKAQRFAGAMLLVGAASFAPAASDERLQRSPLASDVSRA